MRQSSFRRADKIRIRQRLAEFLQADRERRRGNGVRSEVRHDADRSAVREMRRPSRPCFSGWARADRGALLHELRGAKAGEERTGSIEPVLIPAPARDHTHDLFCTSARPWRIRSKIMIRSRRLSYTIGSGRAWRG